MFDIGVVLINYNSSKYTINCIASILEQTSKTLKLQIVVVDNASELLDLEHLKREIKSINLPNINLICSRINTGFGGGNMIGYQHISAPYVSFINNDSILNNDCLSILKDFMDKHLDVGICGPKAYTENGALLPTLDHFTSLGKTVLKRKTLEFLNPEKYPNRKKDYQQPQRGQFVAGSFMFMRTSDFNIIGGFDTNIFLYHEETDICKRLLKHNKTAYLVPDAVFTHFHGVSTKQSIAIKQELKLSLMYVVRKHYGYWHYLILLTYFQISYFFKSLFKPKYWRIFFTFLKGASLAKSMRHQQVIK